MPACEKCRSDAAAMLTADTVRAYRDLVMERKDDPCTPEEQCGEMHLVIAWKDRPDQCRCGEVVKPGYLCIDRLHNEGGGDG